MSADSLSEWLALREPADAAARSTALTRAMAERLAHLSPLRILDLASGTGANLRYLSPHLAVDQRWLLVDRDPRLLAEAPARMPSAGDRGRCAIETQTRDLGTLEHPDIFSGRHLVTASALLDLVSEAWLHTLAARCRAGGAAALFALTYDGRSSCRPAEPEDERIRTLMNRHQRRDKGLGGPAAGPDGVNAAERAFAAAGYLVRREASDWILVPEQRALQQQLIEGWAQAAEDVDPEQAPWIRTWLARRLAHVDAGRSRVVVGHQDLAAYLD